MLLFSQKKKSYQMVDSFINQVQALSPLSIISWWIIEHVCSNDINTDRLIITKFECDKISQYTETETSSTALICSAKLCLVKKFGSTTQTCNVIV